MLGGHYLGFLKERGDRKNRYKFIWGNGSGKRGVATTKKRGVSRGKARRAGKGMRREEGEREVGWWKARGRASMIAIKRLPIDGGGGSRHEARTGEVGRLGCSAVEGSGGLIQEGGAKKRKV